MRRPVALAKATLEEKGPDGFVMESGGAQRAAPRRGK
jgi:hypothetical protein